MHRTLLFIPHEIAGIPVVGVGWLLILLGIFVACRLVFAASKKSDLSQVISSEGLLWGGLALAIVFILPMVELKNVDGDPVGIAIRGYGIFLVCGVGSAIGLAAYRAKRYGINVEIIYAMAPWLFICGIVGARLFYVIQYFDKFKGATFGDTARNLMMFNEGGLVVYGAFIGGFLAGTVFVIKHKLSFLRMGDIIVPCLFIGVFFGRIGCLMNGCCYGGRCEEGWSAIHFPPNSPVYVDQLTKGELLGMKVDEDTGKILSVVDGSLAQGRGIEPGQKYRGGQWNPEPRMAASREIPEENVRLGWIADVNGVKHHFEPSDLPSTALPVQAAQLISSISSLVLCIILCALSRFFTRPGLIMMSGFALYAMLRFGLEIVRVDESGQFNTRLTISQWVSIVVLTGAVVGFLWIYRLGNANDESPLALETPATDRTSEGEIEIPSDRRQRGKGTRRS